MKSTDLKTKKDVAISLAQLGNKIYTDSCDQKFWLDTIEKVKNMFEVYLGCTCTNCQAKNKAWEHLTAVINRLEKTL